MDVAYYLPMIVAILTSIIASGGFWTWFQHKNNKKDAQAKMLLGIAHDRLVYLSMLYLERGHISKEEFENIYEYLYKPYLQLDGNGVVTRLINEVQKLPIRGSFYHRDEEEVDPRRKGGDVS